MNENPHIIRVKLNQFSFENSFIHFQTSIDLPTVWVSCYFVWMYKLISWLAHSKAREKEKNYFWHYALNSTHTEGKINAKEVHGRGN